MDDVYVLATVAAVLVFVGGVAVIRGTANERFIGMSMLVGGVILFGFCCIAVLPMR